MKGNSDALGVEYIAWTFESIAWGVESTTPESIDKSPRPLDKRLNGIKVTYLRKE